MHGATGAEWEIWRVRYPLGEQTGRVGALDRLRSGLGGRQGCVRRATPGADSSLRSDWALSLEGVDGNIHTNGLAIQLTMVRTHDRPPAFPRSNTLLLR